MEEISCLHHLLVASQAQDTMPILCKAEALRSAGAVPGRLVGRMYAQLGFLGSLYSKNNTWDVGPGNIPK